jgi:hypothetical protein
MRELADVATDDGPATATGAEEYRRFDVEISVSFIGCGTCTRIKSRATIAL